MPEPFSGAIKRGIIKFFTERYAGRPFNNCLICAVMTVLRWMGYDVPQTYDDEIRVASGVPDYVGGKPRGMRFSEVMRGLRVLFTTLPTWQAVTDQTLIDSLKIFGLRGKNKAVFAVTVRMTKLPDHYRRFAGLNYTGLHAYAVVAKRKDPERPDVLQLYILDPMQKTETPVGAPADWQPGEFIDTDVLFPAVVRNRNGLIKSIYGFKNGARVTATPVV
jgi:hypothetical protein